MGSSFITSALASSHKALDKANRDFPKPSYKMAHEARQSQAESTAAPKPSAAPAANLGAELEAKRKNIGDYVKGISDQQ
jgi:hypothetical protein